MNNVIQFPTTRRSVSSYAEDVRLDGFDREMLLEPTKRQRFEKAIIALQSLFPSRLDAASFCRVAGKAIEEAIEQEVRGYE